MTSLERAMATVQGRIPDRVPVDLHNFLVAAEMMEEPYSAIFTDARKIAQSQINAWERFRHDILMVEVGTTTLAEAVGCKVTYRDKDAPVVESPLLERLSDVKYLRLPDPYKVGGQMREMIEAIKIITKKTGDKVFVMGRADQGPFSLASQLRGYHDFLLDIALKKNAELIHELLGFCCWATTRYALALIDAGAHGTSMGESIAGPDVVSPDIYREFAFPYERKIIQDLKKKGIIVANHICGNVASIIEKMVETGAAIVEIDEKTNLQKAKKAAQGKTCLLGPISPERLRRGTPEEIEFLCRKALKIAAPGGGFILGPGCAMAGNTPSQNIDVLIRTVEKYAVSF
jgi:uroporphyrinogen decarboxylase